MLTKPSLAALFAFVFLLLASQALSPVDAQSSLVPQASSWAIGLVVPQGSGLGQGSRVDWGSVENVTVVATMPNISRPNGTVYAILSLMTQGGAVMQAALGMYPDSSIWLGYSLYTDGIAVVPQTYHWVVNSSQPRSLPNQTVSLSLSMSKGGAWTYYLKNLANGEAVGGGFGGTVSGPLMNSDQEVFALESYTSEPSTFSRMGNLTVEGVYLNGVRSTGPWYTYGGWDPSHSLPFIVGGSNPPTFIGVTVSLQGIVRWAFTGVDPSLWAYNGQEGVAMVQALGVTVLVCLGVACGRILLGRRAKPGG